MRSFSGRRYFRFLDSVFTQAQFSEFEDIILEQAFSSQVCFYNFPKLSLSFSLPQQVSSFELARVLYVFRRVFNIKPKVSPCSHGYLVFANFSFRQANKLLGFFMYLHAYSQTKFLRFFFLENSFDFNFLLFEPITFFPLVHPGFDYHDWTYPFEFVVNFEMGPHFLYYEEVVYDVFVV